jgi:hypothetical protein
VQDKNKQFQEFIFWHDLANVRTAYSEFHVYLEKNCLFMTNNIRKSFTGIDHKMWDALLKRKIGKEIGDLKMWVEASSHVREQIEPDLKALEDAVQQRLHGQPES